MLSRDLVAEKQALQGKKRPRPPSRSPPRPHRPGMEIQELANELEFDATEHPCLLVNLSDEAADQIIQSQADEGELKGMQDSCAVYYNTHFTVNKAPLWKQIEHTTLGGRPFFIFTMDGCWYCCSDIFLSEEEFRDLQKSGETQTVWWCPRTSDKDRFPATEITCPIWAKEPLPGFSCSLVTENCLELLTSKTIQTQASSSSDDDQSRGHYKAKGKGGHGGWMARTASLIVAYRERQWYKCEELINTYTHMSSKLSRLVYGR